MDSFSKEIMPRAETAHCEVAVMAASTKAARRLGPDDMANASEVLINLVSARQAEGAETRSGAKRLAQKGCGPSRRYYVGSTHRYGRRGKGTA